MPSITPTRLHRIVDRLAEMAADADYAQRRLFEIRTGIDLSDRQAREARDPVRRRRGVRPSP